MKSVPDNIKTGGAMQSFERLKSQVLGITGLSLCLFGGSAFSADTANYDTAWTFTYDGGVAKVKDTISDNFRDVKLLPNGDAIYVGETRDSTFLESILLVKLSASGNLIKKKLLSFNYGSAGASILIAKNGDYFIGGEKSIAPLLLRLDPDFNIKSETWYYDSLRQRNRLLRNATLQALVQKPDGRIYAAGGGLYPDKTNNYAVMMIYDSLGVVKGNPREVIDDSYALAGWSLAETDEGGSLMGGNQAIAILDSAGDKDGMRKYTFSLPGVGTETNNISRVRKMRDGGLIVVGQAYEEDCWTRYQRLSFDGWWSPITHTGTNVAWRTAGRSGTDDHIRDVAQLQDGKIAFIGNKGGTPDSGLWVFVTDSAAETIQWQRQFNLPGMKAGRARNEIMPYSIVATPDSGFIVAGEEIAPNQHSDACVLKFVPKPVPTSLKRSARFVRQKIENGNRVLRFEATAGADVELRILNLQGKELARYRQSVGQDGQGRFEIGAMALQRGLYVWEMTINHIATRGSWAMVE